MQFHNVAKFVIPLSLMLIMGCAPASGLNNEGQTNMPQSVAAGEAPRVNADQCPAAELQYLVGKSRTVLQTMRFGGVVRFEEPGQMYTQEYNASRTRIIIGTRGTIDRIMCG